MSTLSIKVNIAGRVYPLTIEREEEESVRKAADVINKNIKELQANYAVRDMQDLLAMTSLQISSDLLKSTKAIENEKSKEEIVKLTKEIAQFLNQ